MDVRRPARTHRRKSEQSQADNLRLLAFVELPGIEPGSSAASSGLLRVQFAMSLLGSLGHANKPR